MQKNTVTSYIKTPRGVAFIVKGRQFTVASDNEIYPAVMDAIESGKSADEVIEILEGAKKRLEAGAKLTPDITIVGGVVKYKGTPVNNYICDKMLDAMDQGNASLKFMANFLGNLLQNPSYRAVESLYAFLEHGNMPLTEDGCFLAYKAIRSDWKDIHSGTFDNSIGKIVEMPRNQVDEDPNRTCSRGLHVCSYDYLPHFANADGHVVVCKVNPRDVVAIPADYNNTKMRVSRYEVIDEFEDYYKGKGNTLSGVAVHSGNMKVGLFRVDGFDGSVWQENLFSSDFLPEAAEEFQEFVDGSQYAKVRMVNRDTDVVITEEVCEDFDGVLDEDEEDFTIRTWDTEADVDNGNFDDDYFSGTKDSALAEAQRLSDSYFRVVVLDENGGVVGRF